jgi:hypothetical protein
LRLCIFFSFRVLDILEQFSVVGVVLETFPVGEDGFFGLVEVEEGSASALVSTGPGGVEST